MNRSRHILAVVALTTALCADQVVSAAPVSRPPVVEMAARLVVRLSESFSRTVPANVRPVISLPRVESEPRRQIALTSQQPTLHVSLSPFQFRLPPPSL